MKNKMLLSEMTVSGAIATTATPMGVVRRMYSAPSTANGSKICNEIFSVLGRIADKYQDKPAPRKLAGILKQLQELDSMDE